MSKLAPKIWKNAARGVRYREHESRKHNKRADRYYTLVYKVDGKTITEGVGWASDGVKQEDCERLILDLKANRRTGEGPQSYKEMRESNIEKQNEVKEQKLLESEMTLRHIFENRYLPQQKAQGKKEKTLKNEQSFFNLYIADFFRDTPINKIDVDLVNLFLMQLARTKSQATQKELSDSTKRNILGVLSQIFTYAQLNLNKHFESKLENPVSLVKKPRKDNARERFLQPDEAKILLAELKKRSPALHNLSLISLFTGMRAGEILKLTWSEVNFSEKSIYIKDPKNKASRHAFMTAEVESVLKEMFESKDGEKLFRFTEVPHTFDRAVKALGLNNNIDDARQKICFHSLRHTFASWHAKAGTPLYTIAKLLGHKDLSMTQRYAHLCPSAERQAVGALQGLLQDEE